MGLVRQSLEGQPVIPVDGPVIAQRLGSAQQCVMIGIRGLAAVAAIVILRVPGLKFGNAAFDAHALLLRGNL
ncbi:hypothetical protein D3C81_1628860 [compost metagenome]